VLLARQAFGEPIVDLDLSDPFPQRVRCDADLVCRGLDATPPDAEEPDRFHPELRCVRQR
jgi:hypothetical protein